MAIIALAFFATLYKHFSNKQQAKKDSLNKRTKKGKYGYVSELEEKHQRDKEAALKKKFASVSIAHDMDSCKAVQGFSNIRFLTKDSPLIPLKDCSQKHTCNCKYIHHKDRRKVDRRSAFDAGSALIREGAMNDDMRTSKGRRWTDKVS